MSAVEKARALVEPVLAARGLELVDVELAGATLRVLVDGPTLDLDTLSTASQLVSDALDRDDPMPGRYVLEVSSPGVERPLRTPEHFRRFVGATVAVRTRPGLEGERRIEGELQEADDDGITVAGRRLAYGDVERARTVFVWAAAQKPSRARGKARANS